jgi:hypothetical protein
MSHRWKKMRVDDGNSRKSLRFQFNGQLKVDGFHSAWGLNCNPTKARFPLRRLGVPFTKPQLKNPPRYPPSGVTKHNPASTQVQGQGLSPLDTPGYGFLRFLRATSRNERRTGFSCCGAQAITRSMDAMRSASGTSTSSLPRSTADPCDNKATPSPASTSAINPVEAVEVAAIRGEKPASPQREMTLSKVTGE